MSSFTGQTKLIRLPDGRKKRVRMRKVTKPRKKFNNKSRVLSTTQKKQVKKIIANRKEDKYCPAWFQYDDFSNYGNFIQPPLESGGVLPGVYNAGSLACSCVGMQLGNYLTTASTQVNTLLGAGTISPLGGIGMERGDTSTTIDGDYAYMQSCKLQLRITANTLGTGWKEAQCLPLEFRVIQVRPKSNTPSGTTPSLVSSLFVDNTNAAEGLGSSGSVTEVMQNWRINRNQFDVVKDFKFQLSNVQQPSIPATAAGNNSVAQTLPMAPAFPNTKDIELWMNNPKKKLRFAPNDNGSTSYFETTNYQFNEYVIIIAARKYLNQSAPVLVPQSAKFWQVRVNGMTKYRDA